MKAKFVSLFMILLITFSMFLPTSYAREKTLDELKAEAEANRAAYNKAKNQKTLTEAERNQATAQKAEVEKQIKEIQTQIQTISDKILKLKEEISKKDKQMKEIMSYVQVTNGETNYLEYIFGATDFTDFIYRVSVAEQLGNYNEQLINEYNADVKKLDEQQTALTNKNTELSKKQEELSALEAKLNSQIETLEEGMLSKDEEYKTTIALINNLKGLGCKGSETKSSCQSRLNAEMAKKNGGSKINTAQIPSANGTYMPLLTGYVSSDYGYRSSGFHTGIDFSNHAVSDVYSVASGQVVYIRYGNSSTCGNNIVYIYHNIGSGYTTSYWHLTSVSVSKYQFVTANTKIGTIGGPSYTDPCAQGGHVHLNLFNGLTTTNSGRINPRILMPQIPAKGVRFTR